MSRNELGKSEAQANPQMPHLSPPSPQYEEKELVEKSEKEKIGLRAYMPSWDDLRGNPHLRVGIIIDSCSTNDRHIPSLTKPATPCALISVVVLDSEENVDDREESMKKWFIRHQLQSEHSNIIVGWGQEGLKELLNSEVEAVYIIVPPG